MVALRSRRLSNIVLAVFGVGIPSNTVVFFVSVLASFAAESTLITAKDAERVSYSLSLS